jgi:hypothetical protein
VELFNEKEANSFIRDIPSFVFDDKGSFPGRISRLGCPGNDGPERICTKFDFCAIFVPVGEADIGIQWPDATL